jgi:hypothetical protein
MNTGIEPNEKLVKTVDVNPSSYKVKTVSSTLAQDSKLSTNQQYVKPAFPSALEEMQNEEASLREEKEQLLTLKQQLQQNVHKEIELTKNNIEKLKAEIADMKIECEELIRFVNASNLTKQPKEAKTA